MFGDLTVLPQEPSPERRRLLAVAQYFRDRAGQSYTTPRDVEKALLAQLQATKATSGVYSALEKALWETGTRVENSTVGEIMAAFGMTQKELHDALCYCNNGDSVAAAHLATSLTNLAATK